VHPADGPTSGIPGTDEPATRRQAAEPRARRRPTGSAGSAAAKVQKVVEVAQRQHGVVSYEQIRKAGLSRNQIQTRVARGEWSRMLRGVYRIGGAPPTWEAQLRAHLFAAGEHALASHRTAAVLHGLEGFHQAALEISIPSGTSYRHSDVRVHRVADLAAVSSVQRNGCPTTPPARTLLDIAAVATTAKLHLAVEDAIRRNLVSWEGLITCLASYARQGRPGIGPLRTIVDAHRDEVVATDNGFELLVATLIERAGLPRPEVQHEVTVQGRRYRIDLAYPAVKLAVELDGSKHREKPTFERDRARQNALVLAGWTILRYTWDHYVRQSGRIIREIRAVLTPTAPRLNE
jgi:predicted transcriptional regulator of viral defense system